MGTIDFFRAFNGTALAQKWKNVEFEIARDEDLNKDLPPPDFPGLTCTIPVFSDKAKKVLDSLLLNAGEWVNVKIESTEYHVLKQPN